MRKFVLLPMLIIMALAMTNCASIIHGSTQKVDFSSQPVGAKISINGQYYGNTPKTLVLRRKGYSKGEQKVTRNIMFS